MALFNTAHIRHSNPRSWLHRNWWVIVFAAICAVFYLHSMRLKDLSYQEMAHRLRGLEKEKALALAQQEELLLQIQSQSDPAWVEIVLKRNLGMVSEGQTKVYFQN